MFDIGDGSNDTNYDLIVQAMFLCDTDLVTKV